MIDVPHIINAFSFQNAWIDAINCLQGHRWSCYNLVIHVENVSAFDSQRNDLVVDFSRRHHIILPRDVAYTIFPQSYYRTHGSANSVFNGYNRAGGLYSRIHRRARRWGTYFRRMTHYGSNESPVNQLGNIIRAINSRRGLHKAAYTVIIQKPGGETVKPIGSPCLNYLAVQIDPQQPRSLGLLAMYRNHDFLNRAYGNYMGLCDLIQFLARETHLRPGPLTCVSSHAFVENKKVALTRFVGTL